MEEAQIVDGVDACIVSLIKNVVKITKDTMIAPFETVNVQDVTKALNHYKCANVTIDDLPDEQYCKDIAVAHQIQIFRPGSSKLPVIL